MACLLSRKACADYLGVSMRTVRYWDAGRYRVPWAVVRLLRLLRCGDLGSVDAAWKGFRLLRGVLYTPDGRGFPVDALRCWWRVVEQARFWCEDYDRKARVRREAACARRAPVTLASPMPPDGGALDLVPVADQEARAVAGQVARGPDPFTTTPVTAFRYLTAAAPLPTPPDGADRSAQGAPPADEPQRRASALPAVRQRGLWPTSRYARRRWAVRSDAGLVGFLKQVRRHPANGFNLVSECYHQGADTGVTLKGCIMDGMALDCGFPAILDVFRGVPPANRGPTNLNSLGLVSDCYHNWDFTPVRPVKRSVVGPNANRGQKSSGGVP